MRGYAVAFVRGVPADGHASPSQSTRPPPPVGHLAAGSLATTPASAKAAGLERKPHHSTETKQHYIIAAAEMWQHLETHFRKEDISFPKSGRYKDEAAFQAEFQSTIKPLIAARKGIVAFDKIFGFGGTGHIDLFDGETLSDAPAGIRAKSSGSGMSWSPRLHREARNMMWTGILVAGIMGACGGSSPDRAAATAPQPSSAAPVAAPAQAPGAPSAGGAASTTHDVAANAWRITVGQVGAIKLGRPLPPDLRDDDPAPHYVARYIADGQPVDAFAYDTPAMLIILASGPFGAQVEAARERIPPRSDVSRAEAAELAHEVPVKAIMVRGSGPATDAGAGVGSTLAELQRAYGDLTLSALPETLGGDTCRAHSRSLPGIQFMFSTCNRAKAGAPVIRVDVTAPPDRSRR